jgi:hypothetical protein
MLKQQTEQLTSITALEQYVKPLYNEFPNKMSHSTSGMVNVGISINEHV